MTLKARYTVIDFRFRFAAGTSRGVLWQKPSWFLVLEENGVTGIGECSPINGLSIDPAHAYREKIEAVCLWINGGGKIEEIDLSVFPSIAFGLEMAVRDLKNGGSRLLFRNDFTKGKTGISINGLVWMGDKAFMQKQIHEKIDAGYRCIKIKVGTLDIESEMSLLAEIRKEFSPQTIEIRLDANGAFTPQNVMENLERFSQFHIHSIEQPIKPRQWTEMAKICRKSPIPVVLDEELIGMPPDEQILNEINPAYIILKPSLIGGVGISEKWIEYAKKKNIGWWITSALESNIGLNAIAQWTASLNPLLPQGLGTGQMYENNIPSPLEIKMARLYHNPSAAWDLSSFS